MVLNLTVTTHEFFLFPNGIGVAIDLSTDKICADLGHSWFTLYIEFLESKNIDPTKCIFTLPDGKRARAFKTERGWNWSFE